jgi:SAM-dependent methyltransferase
MDAARYDRWYETPRGQWIGQREAALVLDCLQPRSGESLLDVGCGTGYFSRAIADAIDVHVVAVDIRPDWVAYARGRDTGGAAYMVADARALPYADKSFDLVVSILSLGFIPDEISVAREIHRVARRRVAIGLLNRRSLLWFQKGRNKGGGGYRGARWHTVREAKRLFPKRPLPRRSVRSAIQVPSGGRLARSIEQLWPQSLLSGAFLLVCGEVANCA